MGRQRLRVLRLGTIAVAAMLLAGTAVNAEASTAHNPPPTPDKSLYIVTTNGESVVQGITEASQRDPAYRQLALAWSKVWAENAAAGTPAPLKDFNKMSTTDQAAELGTLARTLGAQRTVPSSSDPGAVTAQPSEATPMATTSALNATPNAAARPAGVNGMDPNSFRVSGGAAGDRSYWTNLTLEVDGVSCSMACYTEDVVRTRVTVTPSAKSSMISAQSTYSPNHGGFGNRHLRLYAITSGTILKGQDTTSDGGRFFLTTASSYNSKPLTIAVALYVFQNPTGSYTADGAKTADAHCRAQGDNTCIY